jgi:putative Mn2+ efflux pump MntP
MTSSVGLLGLLLGLDSLVVGLGLGAAVSRRDRLRLAVAFAVCDGVASLLGWAAGAAAWRASLAWCEWLGPTAVAGYGAYVLFLGCRGRRLAEGGGGGLALTVPLCLSLDNLVSGVGDSGAPMLTALAFTAFSGVMALAGLCAGAAVAERMRPRSGWLAGGLALLAVATGLAVNRILI